MQKAEPRNSPTRPAMLENTQNNLEGNAQIILTDQKINSIFAPSFIEIYSHEKDLPAIEKEKNKQARFCKTHEQC